MVTDTRQITTSPRMSYRLDRFTTAEGNTVMTHIRVPTDHKFEMVNVPLQARWQKMEIGTETLGLLKTSPDYSIWNEYNKVIVAFVIKSH